MSRRDREALQETVAALVVLAGLACIGAMAFAGVFL